MPLLWLLFLLPYHNALGAQSTSQAHTHATIVSSHEVLPKGEWAYLGLHLEIEREWHTYWENPGDSASAPILTLVAPQGVLVEDVWFPLPKRIPIGPLTSFGYEHEVYYQIPIKIPDHFQGKEAEFELKAEWVACKVECIPAFFDFHQKLPVATTGKESPHAPAMAQSRASLPKVPPLQGHYQKTGDQLTLTLPPPPGGGILKDLFPFPNQDLAHKAPQIEAQTILTQTGPGGGKGGEYRYVSVWEQTNGQKIGLLASFRPRENSLLMMVGFGLLGGLLLNLMPCVFPVLMLKLISLVKAREAGQSLKDRLTPQLYYLAGVLLSFWSLAAVISLLRSSGQAMGWGLQLQSPYFVAGLVWVFFILGFYFLGLLEVGAKISGIGHQLTLKKGPWGAFFTGVLAVVVASPCTAPFMGAAMGYGLSQPPFVTALIFTGLGLGLALPYLMGAIFPQWVQLIPKPGAWMATLKEFLAFPMFGTMVWLLFIFMELRSPLQTALLLASLVALALLLWALSLAGRTRWVLVSLSILLSLGFAFGSLSSSPPKDSSPWLPFSEEEIKELQKNQQRFFINFTASWCISCQVNDQTTFQNQTVKDFIKKEGIVMMEGDWTHYDPKIGAFLKKFDRAGVPLYLYYSPPYSTPLILPEILTPELFIQRIKGFQAEQLLPKGENH